MELSRLGKVNVALGSIGALSCLLALVAIIAGNSGIEGGAGNEASEEEKFDAYVGAYVLVASLTSIALIWGGLGLTRDRGWGRGVSAAGAGLLLVLLAGGNLWGRVAGRGIDETGGPRDTAAAAVASVLLQLLIAAYAVFVLAKVSRRQRTTGRQEAG